MRRGILFFASAALVSLVVAAPSLATPPADGSGGYTLVENAKLVHPGKDSLTAAQTTSTGDPFTWGAVSSPSRRA